MRELEASLQEFGEFLLKALLARPAAAPYFVRWVRRFLTRPASGAFVHGLVDVGEARPVVRDGREVEIPPEQIELGELYD